MDPRPTSLSRQPRLLRLSVLHQPWSLELLGATVRASAPRHSDPRIDLYCRSKWVLSGMENGPTVSSSYLIQVAENPSHKRNLSLIKRESPRIYHTIFRDLGPQNVRLEFAPPPSTAFLASELNWSQISDFRFQKACLVTGVKACEADFRFQISN